MVFNKHSVEDIKDKLHASMKNTQALLICPSITRDKKRQVS